MWVSKGEDGCGLEAQGNVTAEGQVEYGGENVSQLGGTCSESPPSDFVWSSLLGFISLRISCTWSDEMVGGGEGDRGPSVCMLPLCGVAGSLEAVCGADGAGGGPLVCDGL